MSTRSLRTRSWIAFASALLIGVAALLVGGRHVARLLPGAASTRELWLTLLVVFACANAATLAVIVMMSNGIDRLLAAARASVQALAQPWPVSADGSAPADDWSELREAVTAAASRIALGQQQLRMESDRNRAIIDTVLASVFAVDGGGRIISANPAAVRMFDLPVGTPEGVLLCDLVAADSLRLSVDDLGSVTFIGDTSESRFTTRIRLFGRRSFPAEVSVTPLALDGQRAWAMIVHDLTESDSAQTAVEDARIAVATANRGKTAFIARMSHELRTPLNSMIGFTKIVRRSRGSQLSERDRHYLDRVQASSERLLALVSDIMDLSRIESGTIEMDMTSTDIVPIVREIVAQHEGRLADRPVILDAELPDDAVLADVDAARLQQVLTNLVGNAVKFTARGSVRVTVTRDPDTGRAGAVIVRDTGIGIPLERQAYIFESFEQGGEETSHRYGGSGLGLSLSRRIAQQMGCMLSVESMPGAGSTFTLAFSHANAVPVSASRLFQIDAA